MRNRYRIGALILMLLLALAPFVSAISDPASAPGGGSPAPETQTGASSASGSETPARGSAVTPAEPFIPSESISADSAISFPVDI
jgi:hypothetical protein